MAKTVLTPTKADLAAELFKVTMTAWHGHSSLELPVLAFDEADARVMATLYLAAVGEDVRTTRIELARHRDLSDDMRSGVLEHEHAALWQERQEEWIRRHGHQA